LEELLAALVYATARRGNGVTLLVS